MDCTQVAMQASQAHIPKVFIPKDTNDLYGVHVSGFHPGSLTEDDLCNLFSRSGVVRVCKILAPQNIAFVKYRTVDEARRALATFNGFEVDDHHGVGEQMQLRVRPAQVSNRGTKSTPSTPYRSRPGSPSTDNARSPADPVRVVKGWKINHESHNTTNHCSPTDLVAVGKVLAGLSLDQSNLGDRVSPVKGQTGQHMSSVQQPVNSTSTVNGWSPVSREAQGNGGTPSVGRTSNRSFAGRSVGASQAATEGRLNGVVSKGGVVTMNGWGPVSGEAQGNGWTPSVGSASNHSYDGRSVSATQAATEGRLNGGVSKGGVITMNGWAPVSGGVQRNGGTPSVGRASNHIDDGRSVAAMGVTDVVSYLTTRGHDEEAKFLKENDIDGEALVLLDLQTLLQFMKLGPALKLLKAIKPLTS